MAKRLPITDRFFVLLVAERKLVVVSFANLDVVRLAFVQDAQSERKQRAARFTHSN